MQLPKRLTLVQMQDQWASIINPLMARPANQSIILEPTTLVTGVNVINHLLGRNLQGWVIVDIDAAVTLYRSAPLNNLTLTLMASGPATVTLEVF